MSARLCFNGKIAAGKVSARAGQQILSMLDEFERAAKGRMGATLAAVRRAEAEASDAAIKQAVRRADLVKRTILAQTEILKNVAAVEQRLTALRAQGKAPLLLKGEDRSGAFAALSSFLAPDPHELANYPNVYNLARDITGRAHQSFASAISRMRSKLLGFQEQKVLELDFLRAAFGRTDVSADARADAEAWFATERPLANRFHDGGGAIAPRERYFPNPQIDDAKARAIGEQTFKQLVRETVDLAQVHDIRTGKPMERDVFERLLDRAWRAIDSGAEDALPHAGFSGGGMLANSRDAARLFAMKDAEAWTRFAETVGTHTSPFLAAVDHIHSMASDIAQMEILGPNPAATLRFMQNVLDRVPGQMATRAADLAKGDTAAAVRINQKIKSRTSAEKKSLSNLFGEVTGENRAPVSTEIARNAADARSLLIGAQLGSAMISSFNDPATVLMTARMAGLKAGNVLSWATKMLTEKDSEVFAAQTGMIMDTLAHTAHATDTIMGDTVRSGTAAKMGGAVIRASGLRKWTEALKAGFRLGALAQVASESLKPWGEIDGTFKEALGRVGIGEAEWKIYGQAQRYEPRPNAKFLRPSDVADLGGREARAASEKLAAYVNTFLDLAVIESNPRLRAMVLGDSKPGSISGELRRSLGMYRFFSGGIIYLHGARALARGWDGSRLGHAALSFTLISLLGAVSMQAKEVVAGRDPLSLDPTTANGRSAWFKAVLQGGGLGIFGDLLQVDQTKYGNSWASTFAGPIASMGEDVFGQFLLKNIRLGLQGRDTHFLGDGLYVAARYMPGSSLWYGKLAFQRAVIDQAALWADPRSRERFARIEQQARQNWGQSYWWRPGRSDPARMPAFGSQ